MNSMHFETFESRVLVSKNKLYRFAFRLLGSSEEAKDVVQEVFVKVWNGREQWHTIQNMEAWCMRITKNVSLDRLRSRERKNTDGLASTLEVRTDDQTPYDVTEMNESVKRVHQLMTALPGKQREVMHLRDVEGYSYQEICEILELDMSQVKVYLFRARNAVREGLLKLNSYGLKTSS
jgi:RNA polymerase sigma factor (sigma-70 family)